MLYSSMKTLMSGLFLLLNLLISNKHLLLISVAAFNLNAVSADLLGLPINIGGSGSNTNVNTNTNTNTNTFQTTAASTPSSSQAVVQTPSNQQQTQQLQQTNVNSFNPSASSSAPASTSPSFYVAPITLTTIKSSSTIILTSTQSLAIVPEITAATTFTAANSQAYTVNFDHGSATILGFKQSVVSNRQTVIIPEPNTLLTVTSGSSVYTLTGTFAAVGTDTSEQSGSGASSASKSGLNAGAIVGIVFAVLIILAALATSLFYLCRRRKLRSDALDVDPTRNPRRSTWLTGLVPNICPSNNSKNENSIDRNSAFFDSSTTLVSRDQEKALYANSNSPTYAWTAPGTPQAKGNTRAPKHIPLFAAVPQRMPASVAQIGEMEKLVGVGMAVPMQRQSSSHSSRSGHSDHSVRSGHSGFTGHSRKQSVRSADDEKDDGDDEEEVEEVDNIAWPIAKSQAGMKGKI